MRIVLLIFLLVLNSLAFGSQAPNTLSLKFERKVIQSGSTEVVEGLAYYHQSPQNAFIEVQEPVNHIRRLFIKVQKPINQIMLIDDIEKLVYNRDEKKVSPIKESMMYIYYPVEKRAFLIKAKGPIPMPFIQTILSVMKDDFGLTEMGYTFAEHERKGDTLYTYWNPPRKLKKHLGKFILGTANGLLVSAEARSPKGKTVAKSFYKKHIKLGEKYFPLEVRSEIYADSNRTEEHVTYSDVRINIPLPDEVINFKLPESTKVDEIEW